MASLQRQRVLVIDDDPNVSEVVVAYLEREGAIVSVCADGELGLRAALADPPDLVVLDLMLPGLGADDYVSKPFSPRELVARIKAVLRRAHAPLTPVGAGPALLTAGPVDIDVAAHEVRRDGELLPLTAREFELLVHLVSHPRRAFRREELMDRVWGSSFGDTSTVTVHVRRLREKIEEDLSSPRHLVTVWGVGWPTSSPPPGAASTTPAPRSG